MEVLCTLLATFLKDEMLEPAITRRRGVARIHRSKERSWRQEGSSGRAGGITEERLE